MSESDPREGVSPEVGGDQVDLSEAFEHSAEVIDYPEDSEFEQPAMMAMDFTPPES